MTDEEHFDFTTLLDQQCGYLAKSDGELLWEHHLTTMQIALILSEFIPSITPKDKRLLQLAAITHDIGKLKPVNQDVLRGLQPGPCRHKLQRDEYLEIVKDAIEEADITYEEASSAWEILAVHHFANEKDVREAADHHVAMLSKLVITADHLASMKNPDGRLIKEVRKNYEDCMDFTYVEFGRFPSATTDLSLQTIIETYKTTGWRPLLIWDTSVLFIGEPELSVPPKKDIVDRIIDTVQRKTIALRTFRINSYTGTFLNGIPADHPEMLLDEKRDEILSRLSDGNTAQLYFLKLCFEILSVKQKLNHMIEDSGLLRLLKMANSTAQHPQAKDFYQTHYALTPPEKVNNDFFKIPFEKETVETFLPGTEVADKFKGVPIIKLSADNLFDILEEIASSNNEKTQLDRSCITQLNAWLSMEEKGVDFEAYAQEQLHRYVEYKTTHKGGEGHGICERCASTATSNIADADNFSAKSQTSSQIKSRYGPQRSFCPFCILDNLSVKQNQRNTVWISAKTHAPGIVQDWEELADFICEMCAGLRAPRTTSEKHDVGLLSGLPLPPKFILPYPEENTPTPKLDVVVRGDFSVIVDIAESNNSDAPKNLAVQYAPLYILLRLMGLEVSIGTEERHTLFGESQEVTRAAYNSAFATVILAVAIRQSGSEKNAYVKASEMLSHVPAVAIQTVMGEIRPKKRNATSVLSEDLVGAWMKALKNSQKLITQQGELTMGQLFEDAAFLSKGIQRFCKKPTAGYGWKESKHAASKPISQALETLLRDTNGDIAKQKFRSHLRDDVRKEEEEELAYFITGTDQIIDKYNNICRKSIPEFLKVKNALVAAIYTFTRYPQLTSNIKTEK